MRQSAIRIMAFAMIVGGLLIAGFGLHAMSLASSDVSRFFSAGAPDRTSWILLMGLAVFGGGLAALVPGLRRRDD